MSSGSVHVADGVSISFETDGTADGEPVVLLHGFLGDSRAWDANIGALTELGLRVIRLDHRGHGRSTNVGEESAYTFDHLCRDTLAVADHVGADRFHLVGHSMGGLVAQMLATRHPERLRSLVLVDCSPLGNADDRRFAPALRRLIGYRIGVARTVRLLAPLLARLRTAPPPDRSTSERRKALDDLAQGADDLDPAAFVAFATHLATHDDLRRELNAVTTPTTVIVGEHEIARLRAGADALVSAIDGAVLVEIAGAGHSPSFEQPERFDRAMRDHFARLSRTPC